MRGVLATPVLPTINLSIHLSVLPQEVGKWRRCERERETEREREREEEREREREKEGERERERETKRERESG